MVSTIRYVALLICIAMLSHSSTAKSADSACFVLASSSQDVAAIYYQDGNDYQQGTEIHGQGFMSSPNERLLAVQRMGDTRSGAEVAILDVADGNASELSIIPDVYLIRGTAWSNDSQRLLLQDAYNNHSLYLYDLDTDNLELLSSAFNPNLEVLQVVWSDDDSLIAFVAQEAPFGETEYANVTALYILDLENTVYHPVSLPDENVGWYFEQFYWLGNTLAHSACSINDEKCEIKVATLEGSEIASFSGNYWLVGRVQNSLLLVLDRSGVNEDGSGIVGLQTLDVEQHIFETLALLPVDPSNPIPYYSLSPDGTNLSYVDEEGQTVILDLTNSSTRLVAAATEYDPGRWHPDNGQLLFQVQGDLYIYNLQNQESNLVIPGRDDAWRYLVMWICPQ